MLKSTQPTCIETRQEDSQREEERVKAQVLREEEDYHGQEQEGDDSQTIVTGSKLGDLRGRIGIANCHQRRDGAAQSSILDDLLLHALRKHSDMVSSGWWDCKHRALHRGRRDASNGRRGNITILTSVLQPRAPHHADGAMSCTP